MSETKESKPRMHDMTLKSGTQPLPTGAGTHKLENGTLRAVAYSATENHVPYADVNEPAAAGVNEPEPAPGKKTSK